MDEELNLITELAALNNGTYRTTLIGNLQQEYLRQISQPSFIERLLLMPIEDNSVNIVMPSFSNNYINNIINAGFEDNSVNIVIPSFSNNYINNIINSSFNDKPVYKNVLDPKANDKLKVTTYKNTDKINIECPITQENFLDDTEVIVLPCKHIFMPSAIKQWVCEESASCPICREKLPSIETKVIDNETIPVIPLPNLFQDLITNLYDEENDIQEALVNSLSTGSNDFWI